MVLITNQPKKQKPKSGEPAQIPLAAIIGAGLAALILILFLFHTYVSPLRPAQASGMEHVAPPPGYPDIAPYNTRAWQQTAKPGTRMPGVPPADALQKMQGGQ